MTYDSSTRNLTPLERYNALADEADKRKKEQQAREQQQQQN